MEVSSIALFYHRSEKVWKALGKDGFAIKAPWPTVGEEDKMLTRQAKFLRDTLKRFRNSTVKAKKGWTKASIIVSDAYPEWKVNMLQWMQEQYSAESGFAKTFMKDMKTWSGQNVKEKKLMSETMKFASFTQKEVEEVGVMAMEVHLPFDQKAILDTMSDYIQKQINVPELDVIRLGSEEASEVPERNAGLSSPGKPCIWFR
jgi:leucyl-tRNA synthetase